MVSYRPPPARCEAGFDYDSCAAVCDGSIPEPLEEEEDEDEEEAGPGTDGEGSKGQGEEAAGEGVSTSLVPPYLRAYLGSSVCQRNLLMHVCVSDRGPGLAAGRVESVGRVAVVQPGSLRDGHFAVVRLKRAPSRACGWAVAETRLHRLA
jgi:hypothetical protein